MDDWHKNWEKPVFYYKHGNFYTTTWGWGVSWPSHLQMGKYVDIGFGTYIQAEAGVDIEEGVLVGSHCSIYSVSTINDKRGCVTLKRNCKIGSHTIIMPGVTVGENSIVGAFSYISHDISSNVVVYPKQELTIKDRKHD
jgi:acetyltransferase-like isoleucine patch superfamily enzyme